MDDEGKKCWNCSNFRRYYTRGFCCFVKEENGYCTLCEKWHCHYTSRLQRFNLALNAVPRIYETVAAMEQILLEEKELREFIKKNEE